ncbi:MAG TPA: hypothetical protein VGR95_07920, partial [Thermoanaerobaculia bacterium]|nr:hypothetical protein [Thermoanaerobaculia bacterium]
MGSITFRFSGVCTHFRGGVVPGVPHRVVLCDLTKVQVGALQVIPDPVPDPSTLGPKPVLYYTTPHFAQLDLWQIESTCGQNPLPDLPPDPAPLSDLLNITNVLLNGQIDTGVRLQVINATDLGMTGNMDGIFSLRDFFPNYAPSSEVVLNGRARCYLDLFGGCSWVTPPPSTNPDGPRVVSIRVATDGAPQLLVTPLISSVSAPTVIPLPSDGDFTIHVKNLEADDTAGHESTFEQGAYDYLLHYTTAQGGIPQVLSSRPPGLEPSRFPELPNASLPDIGRSFQIMGAALNPLLSSGRHHTRTRLKLMPVNSVTPACADSQYP